MELEKLFRKTRVVGVVGNSGSGKSSLVLSELIKLRKNHKIAVYILGAEQILEPYLKENHIEVLNSKEDLLDLKIHNAVIYCDEFSDIFSPTTKDKQLTKLTRFFNRIDHLNNFVIISSAHENFWNKFMCGLVKAYFVKTIEFNSLVNGTTLKRKVMGIGGNYSDYRLEMPKDTYYIISDDSVVEKGVFEYDSNLDSKRSNNNPFLEKDEKNSLKKSDKNSGKKDEGEKR